MKEKNLQSKKTEPVSSTNFKDKPTLIKNSIFEPTKEILKEKIIEFYCEKYRIKKYELTQNDDKIIEQIEETIIPKLTKEIEIKHIQNEEQLKEKIKELSEEELNKIELENTLSKNIENTVKKTTDKNIFSPLPSKQETPPVENIPLKKVLQKDEPRNPENQTSSMVYQSSTPIITPKKELNIPTPENLNNVKTPNEKQIPLEKKETLQSSSLEIESIPLPKIELEDIEFLEETPPNLEVQKEVLEETSPQAFIKQVEKQEQKSKEEPKPKQKKETEKKIEQEELKTISLDTSLLDNKIEKINENKKIEITKEEFEDRDYDKLIIEIDILLKEITNLKQKPLTEESKQKLKQKEVQLNQVKNELEIKKGEDLEKEEKLLQEAILDQELISLEEELKKLHIENQIDLNEKNIQKAEDLEFLSKEQVSKIEKELIKLKIKKACKTLELPSILLLPFIRNKYFFYFTTGLFVNNHLNFLNLILRHKTPKFTKPELEEIKRGHDALNESLNITNNNIAYLSYLENDILTKYPELSYDEEYLIYINKLKYNLIKNQEKLLKKKRMIEKYNLKYQVKTRKLKKKKIA